MVEGLIVIIMGFIIVVAVIQEIIKNKDEK